MDTNKKEINYKKFLILEIVIFFLIRISLLFIEHLWAAAEPCRNMLNGALPYCNFEKIKFDFDTSQHIYPPMLYYLYILEYLVIGDLVDIFHPIFIIFELFTLYFCYKLLILYHSKEEALIGIFLFIFYPISIVLMAFFTDVVYAMPFLLASIYYFEKDNIVLSSIFTALGTAMIFIPGIIIVPLFIYYLKNKKIKSFVCYLLIFIVCLVLICLPFLLICPTMFFESLIVPINSPQSSNISYILFGDLPQQVVFQALFINIKIVNFVQLAVLLFFFFYFIKKYEVVKKRDVIVLTVFFIFLIRVLTLYIHPRFDYFTFTMFLILIPYGPNVQNSFFSNKSLKKIIIITVLYVIMSLFCLVYSWNFELYLNTRIHIYLILLYLIIFSVLYSIITFILFNKEKLIKRLLIYQILAVISVVLYKLFYEFTNVKSYNPYLSYFIISYIIFLNYFFGFKFLLIDLSKTKKIS